MTHLRPLGSPPDGGIPAVCPHCWMVNPGPFVLCGRCGASMQSHLQESGGMRRTAPVQGPVPVVGGPRLNGFQRAVVGFFLAMMALGYLAHLLPAPRAAGVGERPVPVGRGP